MTFLRRRLQLVAVAIAIAGAPQVAVADSGPHHPVRMLVPCPAGSPADISARKTAQWWSDNTPRQFFVENFVVGTASASPRTLAEALADNHTILFDLADCDNDASIPQ